MPVLTLASGLGIFLITLIAALGWSLGCWLFALIVSALPRRRG
jgi:hypothetical protein